MIEVDLGREVIDELQVGPNNCRSYLQQTIVEIREVLTRKWQVTLHYAHCQINLTAAVLACLCKEQREVMVVHAEPPPSLLMPCNWTMIRLLMLSSLSSLSNRVMLMPDFRSYLCVLSFRTSFFLAGRWQCRVLWCPLICHVFCFVGISKVKLGYHYFLVLGSPDVLYMYCSDLI